MIGLEANRVVSTAHGEYLVQGLDCFAVSGDLGKEIATAIARHHDKTGAAPDAIVWDDCVLEFRSFNLTFSLLRVFVPFTDPFTVAALDNRARSAIRLQSGSDFELPDVNESLRKLTTADKPNIAHTPGLMRFIGWPEQAPMTQWLPSKPAARAKSISVIVNYRDKSATTIESLAQIRKQQLEATLELILVDNQSRALEREAVENAVHQLFGDNPGVLVRHVRYDAPFNHSYQCNFGASVSTGEVLLMMSNDCHLIDGDTLQTMADWALEPGVGGVMPRIVGSGGAITSAGVSIQPANDKDERPALRIQDCEVDYLSRVVRRTVAVTFACAAISRANWFAAGGLDAVAFPNDYNDADFSLRCARLGLTHIYVGNVEAHHQAGHGDRRTRDKAEAVLSGLLARHDLHTFPADNPYGIRLRRLPSFDNEAANEVCDLIRLYRLAHGARSSESAAANDLRFLRSFEGLVAAADLARDAAADPLGAADAQARHGSLYQKIRIVCAEFMRVAQPGAIAQRYLEAFKVSHDALERLAVMASNMPRETFLPPAEVAKEAPPGKPRIRLPFATFRRPAKPAVVQVDPDAQGEFFSYSDKAFGRAARRLVVFADAMGPTQQCAFQIGMNRARRAGEVAVRIFTEQDLARLQAVRGDGYLAEYLQQTLRFLAPTSCVFSRFADWKSHPIIAEQLAPHEIAQVLLIDDDLFNVGADAGIEHYRQARNPRRVFTLQRIASSSDLIIAASPMLAERLKPHAGASPIVCSGVLAGGRSAAEPFSIRPPKIGYYATAAHAADLEMVAPALLRLKKEFPTLAIEICGSVATAAAAGPLADIASCDPRMNPDYALFRKSLATRGWTIGLAPLRETAFNSVKSPIKWLEHTEAGIATIASNVETYRALGRQGAVLLAGSDDWYGRIVELLSREERRHALLQTSNGIIVRHHGWPAVEERMLALMDRAQAMRSPATLAGAAR